MIKVKKSPGKRGIQWKLQLGSLYDVSLVGGNNFIFIPHEQAARWDEYDD